MVRCLISTAAKTTAAGGLGTALVGSSSVVGTVGTVATIVSSPWFLPVFILSGVVVGGLRAYIKSIDAIEDVNSYFAKSQDV